MAIVRCPSCERRISSLAKSCPHCDEVLGTLTDEQRNRIAMRRWRARIYRARNATYLGMSLVVAGTIAWWLGEPQGLVLPVPAPAGWLLGLGVVAYLASWSALLWLRWRGDPSRPT